MRFRDLAGQKFGRLTVQKWNGSIKGRGTWLCLCNCGNIKIARSENLVSGKVASCGCLSQEQKGKPKTHGGYYSLTYKSWQSMKIRVKKDSNYINIKICDRWQQSYENFLQDMGERPQGTSLGRINNNGNYEPNNCRWETPAQQSKNKSDTVIWTIEGVTMCMKEWADHFGVSYTMVVQRRKKGWSPEECLFGKNHKSMSNLTKFWL